MNEPPTVSVAMINRDYGRYIADAIDSALQQEPPPSEVVVVDDGSTDDSGEVLARYGSRVRTIATGPRGKGAATNAAVAACSGDVVAFLDSDDLMLPGRLVALSRAYAENPAAGWVWHRMGHVERDTMSPAPSGTLVGYTTGRHDHRAAVARGRLPITTPATSALSWRRTFLSSLLPMAPGLRTQDNYLKLLSMGLSPGVVLDEVLSLQGLHGANAYTGSSGRQKRLRGSEFVVDMAPGLREHGLAALHRRLVAGALITSVATATLDPSDRAALRQEALRVGLRLVPALAVEAARTGRGAFTRR